MSCRTFPTPQISPGFFSKFDSIKPIDQQLCVRRLGCDAELAWTGEHSDRQIECSARTTGLVWTSEAPILNEPLRSPTRHDRASQLTPGSVFCSCRLFWAASALSRWQYVRKAQPAHTVTLLIWAPIVHAVGERADQIKLAYFFLCVRLVAWNKIYVSKICFENRLLS